MGSQPQAGVSPRPLCCCSLPRHHHRPVALALLWQHSAASLSHHHPAGSGGAAAGVGVRAGAEGHSTQCHPCPALQRGTSRVELWERNQRHPEPRVPGDGWAAPFATSLPSKHPGDAGAGGWWRRPTSVRTGGQLSWTHCPWHSWWRVQPSPHQPQPMKRSARRQRWHVEKWRQPGPVMFRRHTWGQRAEVSRAHGACHPPHTARTPHSPWCRQRRTTSGSAAPWRPAPAPAPPGRSWPR